LIVAMAEMIYPSVTAPDSVESLSQIKAILRACHGQVLRDPGLALLIFSRPEVNILVYFTHGAALVRSHSVSDTAGP